MYRRSSFVVQIDEGEAVLREGVEVSGREGGEVEVGDGGGGRGGRGRGGAGEGVRVEEADRGAAGSEGHDSRRPTTTQARFGRLEAALGE